MNWQNLFSSKILDRGYDYYADGHVEYIKKINGSYEACVSGTEDYAVHIHYDGERISDMECTCPYAAEGNRCKHMAAVLFKIDEQGMPNDKKTGTEKTHVNPPPTLSDRIKKAVRDLAPEIVREELISVLLANENLSTGFLARHTKNEGDIKAYISNMKQTAKAIQRQCSDRHQFVDWRNASTFALRLINEVLLVLRDFQSDPAEAKAAFDVSLFVHGLFADTDIDDSGGETQFFSATCLEIWEEILVSAEDNELAAYMLDKLNKECDRIGIGEYMAEQIDEFISGHFTGEGFALTKLETIDTRIARFANDKSWHGQYQLSKCIKERIAIMQELQNSEADIKSFRNKYWHLPVIREMEMQELEDAGNLAELIDLLEKSKEIDKEYTGLFSKYSKKLIECYKKAGWLQKAKDELYAYITEYSPGNRDAFIELRSCTDSDSWPHVREEIFSVLSEKQVDIKPLLAAEELKTRLFGLLMAKMLSADGFEKLKIAEIGKYETILRPEYDEQLLDIYEKMIWKMSEFAGGRSHYQEIVRLLKKMFPYPGGKDRVRAMLESWRFCYSNRPAMQEELSVLFRA